MLENKLNLPEKPGIYVFRTAAGKPLYIGKALNLKKRVSQYFQKKDNPMLRDLLQRAAKLEYVVTASEHDALLLEANLVQSYQPPFNIRLKDDKRFPSIQITLSEDFPGIYYSRQVVAGDFGLGPLVSSQKTRSLIDTVTRLFRIRSCSNTLFRKGVPCLYFHIERCSAPCAGKIEPQSYRRQVQAAIDFLKGRKGKVASQLAVMMRRCSAAEDFEQAQKLKEDLELLEGFSLRSYISTRARLDWDILVSSSLGHESFFAYFSVIRGQVRKSEYVSLTTIDAAEDEVMRGFLLDFYRSRPLPGEIIVSRLPEQAEALERLLSVQAGRRVHIRTPRRGRKKDLLAMAAQNLALFIQKSDYRFLAEKIRAQFRLGRTPLHIEGVDISHLSEKNRVGAVVVYTNGRPERRSYRNYIIRSAAPGDTEAIKEVLRRRFDANAQGCDLLLIDGGLPQLAAARQVKKKLGLGADLLALAKGEERIYMEDGSSQVLEPGSLARNLLQNIRDEVHRRAVTHHRKRREKI
ncbi:MAG TPA: excinuclease ABC subunit UvrC [Candidatus Binatia bacterium]|nr:excinuclease ABC subunit UvrC [Candidatus Binatia bacterium]